MGFLSAAVITVFLYSYLASEPCFLITSNFAFLCLSASLHFSTTCPARLVPNKLFLIVLTHIFTNSSLHSHIFDATPSCSSYVNGLSRTEEMEKQSEFHKDHRISQRTLVVRWQLHLLHQDQVQAKKK
eukprot:TRINITY_DN1593_c0_g1_i2.p1 TRINITY_DN1593_c0_g1~~TRINITY_DN1593_c0_g1_i2.p1  ORF type:complete len:128 (-),score=3.95 TRINITY_DN1593_c0_g1_i2:40-423(-)